MSWFKRTKAFVAKQPAKAADLESEFDNVAEALNGLFEADHVQASATIEKLKSKFEDVPGTTVTVSPSVPSLLLAIAIFDFEPFSAFAYNHPAIGQLFVDDVATGAQALFEPSIAFVEATEIINRATVSQTYSVSLTAGSHELKLCAMCEGAAGNITQKCLSPNTGFLYLLIPDPEP